MKLFPNLTRKRLLLGVTVHEFMLISICQCLYHIMIVSWSHSFIGYAMSYNDSIIGFAVSIVLWFHRVHGVNGFMGFVVSMVLWFHWVRGFMVS